MTVVARPQATIIVCTHSRAAMLRDALGSILADASTVRRELIVVDNASTDGTAEYLRQLRDLETCTVVALHEQRLGLSHARNTGVKAARGEVLLFTDDDVIVESGWADALVAPFDDPDITVVAGRILPQWETPRPGWLDGPHAMKVELRDGGPSDRSLGGPDEVFGANLALRAESLRSLERPFDPSLGVRGKLRFQAEEADLVRRLLEHGRGVYRADAVLRHRVDPARLSVEWMRASYFDEGICTARYHPEVHVASFPRRAVRAYRTYRAAAQTSRRNDGSTRGGAETADELLQYRRAGREFEIAFGATPWLSEWASTTLRRRGR